MQHNSGSSIGGNVDNTGRGLKGCWVYALLWAITFILYLPAARAGWVHDTVDWLKRIKEEKFWDYINIMQSLVPSLRL